MTLIFVWEIQKLVWPLHGLLADLHFITTAVGNSLWEILKRILSPSRFRLCSHSVQLKSFLLHGICRSSTAFDAIGEKLPVFQVFPARPTNTFHLSFQLLFWLVCLFVPQPPTHPSLPQGFASYSCNNWIQIETWQ